MKLNPHLSDLFFNSEHPAYDALFANGKNEATQGQILNALTQDAQDFCVNINAITAWGAKDPLTPEQCAADFLARL